MRVKYSSPKRSILVFFDLFAARHLCLFVFHLCPPFLSRLFVPDPLFQVDHSFHEVQSYNTVSFSSIKRNNTFHEISSSPQFLSEALCARLLRLRTSKASLRKLPKCLLVLRGPWASAPESSFHFPNHRTRIAALRIFALSSRASENWKIAQKA